MAGFGRHHVLHESTFFELAGTLTVEVEFIVTDEEAQQLLALVQSDAESGSSTPRSRRSSG